jgi:hypothetical protein
MNSISQIIEMLVNSSRMWKEAAMIYNKILTRKLPEGTDESHRSPETGQPV